MIAEPGEIAVGRDDVGTECAGTLSGSWFASPASSYAETWWPPACCVAPAPSMAT